MKTLATCIAFIALLGSLHAQDSDTSISFDNGSIPNAPAFILLDKAPTLIERPDTAKAFGVQLLQDFEDGILDNIAIEFTPFWYTKPKKLTALKMRGIERIETSSGEFYNKQNYFAGLRFVNVSLAYSSEMDSIQNIAIGARATIFEYKHQDDIKRLVDANAHNERILKEKILLFNEFLALPGKSELASSNKTQFQIELDAFIKEKKLKSANTVYEALKIKPILAIDGAIAYNARYTDNTFESSADGRFGAWLTAAYAQPLGRNVATNNYINMYGFFRYLNDQLGNQTFNAIDLGLKVELEFERLSFGYEYISRSGDLDSYRSAGSIAYKLSNNTYVTGSFGNNFGATNDLISLLGLRWGLDNKSQQLD
jgi:hypothetical protein